MIYCKEDYRLGEYPETKFDFLDYTLKPRKLKTKYGKYFANFSPTVSNLAKKSMQQKIHGWRIHLKTTKTLEELSHMFNTVLIRWINYYGLFYKSGLSCVFQNINNTLIHWAQHKYKKLAGRKQ
jgi:RNA-directed DNA polymerase